MKVRCFFLSFLLCFVSINCVCAQEDISGHWTGKLYQDAGGMASDYLFELDLKQLGTSVMGTSHIDLGGRAKGTMQVVGTLNVSVFSYKEPRILAETGIADTNAWCLKTCRLLVSRVGDQLYLKGTWTGFTRKFGQCKPGTIELTKYAPLPSKSISIVAVETGSIPVKIVVVAKESGERVKGALISIEEEGRFKVISQKLETGIWEGMLSPEKCKITAQGTGYYIADSTLVISNGNPTQIVLQLVKIRKGDVFKMERLYFEQSKAVITPQSDAELQKLIDFMKINEGVKILIAGHTDNVGSSYANKVLSIDRTKAVQDYLENHGIEGNRMVHKGYGEDKPVATNQTAKGRAKNRRVEVEILEL